jgi:hypothetical protein
LSDAADQIFKNMAGKREIRKNENPHLKKKSGTGVNGCNKNREKFCRSADENVQA